jgi:1-acyl-sn-glycerol-3-phosphate acyltransferase
MVAEIAGVDAARLRPDLRIGDALTSLDRVELATRIETVYGLTLGEEAFQVDRTLAELGRDLRPRESTPPGSFPAGMQPPDEDGGSDADGGEERRDEPNDEITAPAPRSAAIPVSAWRCWWPVRAARFVLREAVMHPLLAGFVRLTVSGRERFDAIEPPFLIAANHQSLLDPAAVLMALPARTRGRLAPAARWSFFSGSRRRRLEYTASVLGFNTIPLVQAGDWRRTLEIAGRLVDRGACPLIFPEGSRSTDGEIGKFELGAALIAQELHLPLLPCALAGLWSVLPRNAHWPRRPRWFTRGPVAVVFGTPLPAPGPEDDLRRVTAELRTRVQALHGEARAIAGRP